MNYGLISQRGWQLAAISIRAHSNPYTADFKIWGYMCGLAILVNYLTQRHQVSYEQSYFLDMVSVS